MPGQGQLPRDEEQVPGAPVQAAGAGAGDRGTAETSSVPEPDSGPQLTCDEPQCHVALGHLYTWAFYPVVFLIVIFLYYLPRLSVMLQEGHMALGKAVLFWTDKFAYLYKEKRHL